ncbi:cyclin-like protein, partial [Rozella allomycis CSF55]
MRIQAFTNPLASPAQLQNNPTIEGNVSAETESLLRLFGSELIQTAGELLNLPQVCMATAQVLFQRFYVISSFVGIDLLDTAMGALLLATKIEECTRRAREIIH